MQRNTLNEAQSTYLNFLRAMAAMAVLFGHAFGMFFRDSIPGRINMQGGGVLIFFLISGFLISYSVFQKQAHQNYGFTDYLIDRFCRIYTAYLPALFFVLVIDYYAPAIMPNAPDWPPDPKTRTHIVTWFGNLFMLQDFPLFQVIRRLGIPDSPWLIRPFGSSPFWTVSIEWWLYMAFGAITLLRLRSGKPFALWQWPLVGFAFVVPAYYLVAGTDNCLSLLWVVGMVGSLVFLHLPTWTAARNISMTDRKWRFFWLMTFVASVGLMAVRMVAIKLDDPHKDFIEFQFSVFLALALFSLLLVFGTCKTVPGLLKRGIGFVADYSYSLYLTHASILMYLYVSYPEMQNNVGLFLFAIALTNVFAILFAWLFERHYRKLAKWMKMKVS